MPLNIITKLKKKLFLTLIPEKPYLIYRYYKVWSKININLQINHKKKSNGNGPKV